MEKMKEFKELKNEALSKVAGGVRTNTINPGIYNINGVNYFQVTQPQTGAFYNPVNGIALIKGDDGKLHKNGNAMYNIGALLNKNTVVGFDVVD